MTWLLPDSTFLAGLEGFVRTVGEPTEHAKKLARDRLYRERNRDRLRAYHRALYHAKRKEKAKAYYQATRERDRLKRRAQQRARYWADPVKYRAQALARYHAKKAAAA